MSHENPQESDDDRKVTARNVAIALGAGAVVGGVITLERKRRQKIAEALLPPEDYSGPTKHGRALMIAAKVHVEGSMPKPELLEWLQVTLDCKPKSAVALVRRLTLGEENALLTEREVMTETGEIRREIALTDAMAWAAASPEAPKNELLNSYITIFEAEKQAVAYASGNL